MTRDERILALCCACGAIRDTAASLTYPSQTSFYPAPPEGCSGPSYQLSWLKCSGSCGTKTWHAKVSDHPCAERANRASTHLRVMLKAFEECGGKVVRKPAEEMGAPAREGRPVQLCEIRDGAHTWFQLIVAEPGGVDERGCADGYLEIDLADAVERALRSRSDLGAWMPHSAGVIWRGRTFSPSWGGYARYDD